ncbi:hypothetical protein DQ04_09101020 [Trypanosoma grayi]|uniref:hypothetical protein n=1 Tax=Trypanosoma grayi TaxID=71804 RepID=UPI0004F4B6BE|nr:hypothetical protein DQ04_09101020 [Trypanosoma grayi]KEG07683.1 hypothetical protein DQ04_09101020 [Trypanosoma grayi]
MAGVLIAMLIEFRRVRAARLRESVIYDVERRRTERVRVRHPEALPHETPSYPDVVNAYALIPKSQIRLLNGASAQPGTGNEEGEEMSTVVQDMEDEEEDECTLHSLCSRSKGGGEGTWGLDASGNSSVFLPPHLGKAASIHANGGRFRESITLLRKLSSHIIFGRASYMPREENDVDEHDEHLLVDLPGIATVETDSRSSCITSSLTLGNPD